MGRKKNFVVVQHQEEPEEVKAQENQDQINGGDEGEQFKDEENGFQGQEGEEFDE